MTFTKRRRTLLPTLIILMLGVACALLALAALAFVLLPDLAEENFGMASPRLSPTQRVLYSARLFMAKSEILEPLD